MAFYFITKRPLWQNILLAILISLCLSAGFLLALNVITNHGEYLTVPEVKGRDFKLAQSDLEKNGFEVVIQDSIYIDTLPPNIIIKQFPEPEATVKVNRVIYLTINCAVPPSVGMPNLVGMTFRNALMELKSLGLKLGDTIFVPNISINTIKDQLIAGVPIKPGSSVRMGTLVDLVIGAGIPGQFLPVPDLFGLTYSEAMLVLEVNGINIGSVSLDANLADTSLGFIYSQNPMPLDSQFMPNKIQSGQLIDIRLSSEKPILKIDSVSSITPK